jgi:dihydrofolate reductase
MTKARLSLIVAVAKNGVIGAGNQIPWRLSTDMKRFKSITMGKPVIMGRKTYESIGKPLRGRHNIVVSRDRNFSPDGVDVVASFEAALAAAGEASDLNHSEEIMVIGGGEIYRIAIEMADRLYVTFVDAAPKGDTYFPTIDQASWRAISSEQTAAGPKDSVATTFVVYDRVGSQWRSD